MNLESSGQTFLGIEGGGTRTVAILAEANGNLARRLETGPANVRLLNDRDLKRHFEEIAAVFPSPSAIGVGLAGARTEQDCARISKVLAMLWPGVPALVSHDLETGLLAAANEQGLKTKGQRPRTRDQRPKTEDGRTSNRGAKNAETPAARVLVLSGTGSCCFGRDASGATAKVGGWGHVLGDKGSGYEIGLRGLKAVVYYYDRDGRWPVLGERLLAALQLNEPDDLVGWAQNASKQEIAELAIDVFEAARDRDRTARDILEGAVHTLAKDAVACAKRLVAPSARVEFVLAGSVLMKQPGFAKSVGGAILSARSKSDVLVLPRESAWGAVELAKQAWQRSAPTSPSQEPRIARRRRDAKHLARRAAIPSPVSSQLSPTEQRNPRSMDFHRMNISEAIALMLGEEERVAPAVLAERKKLERGVRWIARAFKSGGRLFYVGAGTSGRLGVLDASECPPTFRVPPQQVQGIIAGGHPALWRSIEGAEDDAPAGARAVQFRGVTRRDVVVGIAASGRTAFVWGAMSEAKRRGARTILVCFNPYLTIPRAERPSLVIAPKIGPEVLTGSTRLKAGTATKLILNLFTTLPMVRIGKVVSNLMVDVNPSNKKLRERAVRIVQALTGNDADTAREALERSGWVVKEAWRRGR